MFALKRALTDPSYTHRVLAEIALGRSAPDDMKSDLQHDRCPSSS